MSSGTDGRSDAIGTWRQQDRGHQALRELTGTSLQRQKEAVDPSLGGRQRVLRWVATIAIRPADGGGDSQVPTSGAIWLHSRRGGGIYHSARSYRSSSEWSPSRRAQPFCLRPLGRQPCRLRSKPPFRQDAVPLNRRWWHLATPVPTFGERAPAVLMIRVPSRPRWHDLRLITPMDAFRPSTHRELFAVDRVGQDHIMPTVSLCSPRTARTSWFSIRTEA
jgi:hypothetical protein